MRNIGKTATSVIFPHSIHFYFVSDISGIVHPHNIPIAGQYLENISPINIEYAACREEKRKQPQVSITILHPRPIIGGNISKRDE